MKFICTLSLDYQMRHDCARKQLKCYSYPTTGTKVLGLDSRNVLKPL